MATLKGGLCLILILWTAGSRSRSVPTRSPDASYWTDRSSKFIKDEALSFRRAGDFRSAEAVYHRGYEEAVRRRDSTSAVKFLESAGGCQLADFRYRDALATFMQARELAIQSGDHGDLAGISLNLSSVYTQIWDYSSALRVAEEGLHQILGLSTDYALPYLLLQVGRLHSVLGDEDPIPYLVRGVEAARVYGDTPQEALGWDRLGEEYLKKRQWNAAEGAFSQAYRLRALFHKQDLGYSYAFLGALRLAERDLPAAATFTKHALDVAKQAGRTWPIYLLQHQLGQIERKAGHIRTALENLEAATAESAASRLQVIPSQNALSRSNIGIEQDVVRDFAELAASYAIQTGSAAWSEKAFRAMELNRAASLRESIALRDVWRARLPSRYWEVLARLQDSMLRSGPAGKRTEEDRLRLEISEMEAQAGLHFIRNKNEIFLTQTSLIHFREGLGESELLLSFLLGKEGSFLWAASRDGMHLYRLPSEQEIAAEVRRFREAVRDGAPETEELGYVLYKQLFGKLDWRERRKTRWLFSAEGVVFDVPFSALVSERRGGRAVYLIEGHTIQTVPGATFLFGDRNRNTPKTGTSDSRIFLGVGDAIYNAADSRWMGSRAQRAVNELSRLPASGSEVLTSARAWTGEVGAATILLGNRARTQRFLDALNQFPSVIHLATHVQIPDDRRDQGLIAFSLAPRTGQGVSAPEFLDTMQVSALHLRDALVVMTGCETGAGDAQKGAGLLGLTRAWLMAGARGVVSTTWPVEDTGGEIFASFYRHLSTQPPAEALRLSQLEMLHSKTWHRDASYWAAYQLTGGIR
jgi:CHAT domain-containing protein